MNEPNPPPRPAFLLATASGLMAVVMAALSSHALDSKLAPGGGQLVELAVLFQLSHAICLLVLFFIWHTVPSGLQRSMQLAAIGFCAGLVLFCLPIYWLAFNGPGSLGHLSFLTPIGGTGFLVGWAALTWVGFRYATRS